MNIGTYDHSEAQIVVITNPSKPVYISTRHVIGGFFGGNRAAHSGTLGLRAGDKFKTELKLSHNNISLPNGDFTTTVFGGRVSYSFNPRMFTQSLIQYNSVTESISANIRFGLIKQANTGLFLVYNENWDDGSVVNRSFTVKYSHLIDLL